MQALGLPRVSSKEQHRPKATLDFVLLGIPGWEMGDPWLAEIDLPGTALGSP